MTGRPPSALPFTPPAPPSASALPRLRPPPPPPPAPPLGRRSTNAPLLLAGCAAACWAKASWNAARLAASAYTSRECDSPASFDTCMVYTCPCRGTQRCCTLHSRAQGQGTRSAVTMQCRGTHAPHAQGGRMHENDVMHVRVRVHAYVFVCVPHLCWLGTKPLHIGSYTCLAPALGKTQQHRTHAVIRARQQGEWACGHTACTGSRGCRSAGQGSSLCSGAGTGTGLLLCRWHRVGSALRSCLSGHCVGSFGHCDIIMHGLAGLDALTQRYQL